MLLVSDYGKLTKTYSEIDSEWSAPDPAQVNNTLTVAAKQWFYEALIPTAYPYLIRGDAGNARKFECNPRRAGDSQWPNQPDQNQMSAITGYQEDGKPITSIFFFTQGRGVNSSPPAGLGDQMFRPIGAKDPGLGIEKLQFFTPRVFNGKIAHAITGSELCGIGWMPNT
jgi:hypothetical protein